MKLSISLCSKGSLSNHPLALPLSLPSPHLPIQFHPSAASATTTPLSLTFTMSVVSLPSFSGPFSSRHHPLPFLIGLLLSHWIYSAKSEKNLLIQLSSSDFFNVAIKVALSQN